MKFKLPIGVLGLTAILTAGPITMTYTGGTSTYTASVGGVYQIVAYGASGGGVFFASSGGYGAEIGGDFILAPNEILDFYIGGAGGAGNFIGRGGGGTFVQTSTGTLLLAAGGGGGGYVTLNPQTGKAIGNNGADASTGTGGGGIYGGSNGNGGSAWFPIPPNGFPPSGGGGGGGGYFSAGAPLTSSPSGGGGGAFPTLTGGKSGGQAGAAGNGGYGGGGGGYFNGGFTAQGALIGYSGGPGGGGGYSGGGGGAPLDFAGLGQAILAGGGGSYWDASITNVIAVSTGNFDHDGFATINYVGPAPAPPSTPEPGSFFLFGFGVVTMAKFRRSLYL